MLTRNGVDGILLSLCLNVLVSKNNSYGNGFNGIRSGGSLGVPGGNTFYRNTLTTNASDGIFLDAGAIGSFVTANTSSANGDDGIDSDASDATISRNITRNNVDLGIEAVVGVTDGGGNRATGNGNPAQCLNVVCHT